MLFNPYWRRTLIILLLSVISAYVAVLPIQILGIVVDEIKIADKFIKNPEVGQQSGKSDSDSLTAEHKSPIPLSKPLLTASDAMFTSAGLKVIIPHILCLFF